MGNTISDMWQKRENRVFSDLKPIQIAFILWTFISTKDFQLYHRVPPHMDSNSSDSKWTFISSALIKWMFISRRYLLLNYIYKRSTGNQASAGRSFSFFGSYTAQFYAGCFIESLSPNKCDFVCQTLVLPVCSRQNNSFLGYHYYTVL